MELENHKLEAEIIEAKNFILEQLVSKKDLTYYDSEINKSNRIIQAIRADKKMSPSEKKSKIKEEEDYRGSFYKDKAVADKELSEIHELSRQLSDVCVQGGDVRNSDGNGDFELYCQKIIEKIGDSKIQGAFSKENSKIISQIQKISSKLSAKIESSRGKVKYNVFYPNGNFRVESLADGEKGMLFGDSTKMLDFVATRKRDKEHTNQYGEVLASEENMYKYADSLLYQIDMLNTLINTGKLSQDDFDKFSTLLESYRDLSDKMLDSQLSGEILEKLDDKRFKKTKKLLAKFKDRLDKNNSSRLKKCNDEFSKLGIQDRFQALKDTKQIDRNIQEKYERRSELEKNIDYLTIEEKQELENLNKEIETLKKDMEKSEDKSFGEKLQEDVVLEDELEKKDISNPNEEYEKQDEQKEKRDNRDDQDIEY